MSIWTIVQIYLLVILAIGCTSYVTLYRPAIQLLHEILEQKTFYSGWISSILWIILASIGAPFILIALISNDNDKFINALAVTLADKYIEDDGSREDKYFQSLIEKEKKEEKKKRKFS